SHRYMLTPVYSESFAGCKTPIVDYLPASLPSNADALRLADLRLPIPTKDKEERGFKHRATTRALIPPEDQSVWDADPDLLMRQIRTREHYLDAREMPSFVYKNYITDTTDPAMGAFWGELLVTFLKHLFRGPEAAKSNKPPKPGRSATRQIITAAEMVAYAVLMLRHALSSDKDWRMNNDGVAKAVVWRSCLQVFYPDLTMDLGVEEYDEDAKAASIFEKKFWARKVLEELTERVSGVQGPRPKRASTTRPKRPFTATQIARNFAKKYMQAQSATSRPLQEPEQEVPPAIAYRWPTSLPLTAWQRIPADPLDASLRASFHHASPRTYRVEVARARGNRIASPVFA
ncbi:hypothetical protein EV122DRAFT_256007, partial [Schizophyllum commune]